MKIKVLVLTLLIAGTAFALPDYHTLSQRLHIGMIKEQVKNIMGEPVTIRTLPTIQQNVEWVYVEGTCVLQFNNENLNNIRC